ncbi:MAG TPA: sulfite exporter TauE/SafE family protein [Gaiellaceae bacterium]|nr:sulfite exporter TauE/SafE family protein [Gaiellaceae bacterium]
MTALELLLAFAGSFVAGALGSLVGLVLGSVRLPAVLLASGSPAAAAGTNIAVSAAAALSGGIAHARAGRVSWRIVGWMAPPSVAGAFAGGYVAHAVPSRLLLAGIAVVLAWNGLDLLLELRAAPDSRRPRLAAVVAGGLIGLLGGAVGLILGTLRLPALLRSVGLSAHMAVGTNLVVGFFLGAAGFAAHLVRLEVEWLVLLVSLAGAVPGAWLGARHAGRIPEEALRRLIGAALLLVAVAIAVAAAV